MRREYICAFYVAIVGFLEAACLLALIRTWLGVHIGDKRCREQGSSDGRHRFSFADR